MNQTRTDLQKVGSMMKSGFREGVKQYYLARGWDEHGIPNPEILKKRGLDFVIGKLD